ncbi:hypothetical protein BIY23_01540 [Wolbachia pipientis]|uniref:Tetratricopeptide repeat protein n=2 Tax=Wolbachia pipientis TaxID=955 RepID=A0A1E7QL25_WOLPI|nr:hypothetical protein BIY23_01540 [Wolbachia pipientis]
MRAICYFLLGEYENAFQYYNKAISDSCGLGMELLTDAYTWKICTLQGLYREKEASDFFSCLSKIKCHSENQPSNDDSNEIQLSGSLSSDIEIEQIITNEVTK